MTAAEAAVFVIGAAVGVLVTLGIVTFGDAVDPGATPTSIDRIPANTIPPRLTRRP